MSKDRTVYIHHIYDCICWIKEYVQDGKEAFFEDRKTQDAVIRNLEVIGQAVKDFGTDSLTSSHPDAPWQQIAATRNFLAHQYLGVDLKLIWNNKSSKLQRTRGLTLMHQTLRNPNDFIFRS